MLLAAAATAGRRVLGLAPGPQSYQRVMSCLRGLDPARRPLAEVRPGGPALLLQAGNPDAGQAALAVTGCGQPAPPGACPAGTAGGGEPAAGPACCTRPASGCCGPAACWPSSPPAHPARAGCMMGPARRSPGPAPPGWYTPSTSSPCTPPSATARSPPAPAIPPPGASRRTRARPQARPQRRACVHQSLGAGDG